MNCVELALKICKMAINDREQQNIKNNNAHFSAVSASFGRSPKLLTYFVSRMPEASFEARISHLFRNTTRSTFASKVFEHRFFHRITESSNRFTLLSSASVWSKPDIGARKMMAEHRERLACHLIFTI